jgi:hypothetical protein
LALSLFSPVAGSSPRQPFLVPEAIEQCALLVNLHLLRGRRPVVQIVIPMRWFFHRRA